MRALLMKLPLNLTHKFPQPLLRPIRIRTATRIRIRKITPLPPLFQPWALLRARLINLLKRRSRRLVVRHAGTGDGRSTGYTYLHARTAGDVLLSWGGVERGLVVGGL